MDSLERILSVCRQQKWIIEKDDLFIVTSTTSTFSISDTFEMKHVSGDELNSLKCIRDLSVLALDKLYYPVTMEEMVSEETL
jgi:hypothetical protein